MLFIPVNSLATTANSLVSNTIGAGHKEEVLPLISKIVKFCFVIVGVFSIVVALFPRLILSIYTNDPVLIDGSVQALYVISVAILISAFGNIYFNGVSGTGNTRTALVLELITLAFYCLYIHSGHSFKVAAGCMLYNRDCIYVYPDDIVGLVFEKGNWQKKRI